MEQVGLQHAAPVDRRAVAERDQVGLGQPVGLAPDAAARSVRPSERSHRLSAGVPVGGPREPRARRPSRRTCRPARCARRTSSTAGARRPRSGPTSSHLAAVVSDARPRRRRSSTTGPASSSRAETATGPRHACERQQHADAERRPCTITGTSRQQLDQRRGRPQPRAAARTCGSSSPSAAARRSRTGGLPSQDVPGLGLLRASPTAPRPGRAWAPRARARSSPSCRGRRACRSWPRSIRSQPPAELVGRRPCVSSARNAPSPDRRHRGQQQHRRRLDVRGRPSRRAPAATPA